MVLGNPLTSDTIFLFLTTHSELFIYFTLFSVLVLTGVGLPVPEEVTLLGSGFLAFGGFSDLAITVIVCFVGVIIGDLIVFSLGRRWGNDIIRHRYLVRFVSERRLNKAITFFKGHGSKTIFIVRFISGFRIVVFAAAGTLRMRMASFIAMDMMAAMISVPILISIGYLFGANYDVVVKVFSRIDNLIITFVSILIGVILAYFFCKKKEGS